MLNSKCIVPGDRIIAVGDVSTDSDNLNFDLQKELKGENVPGSKVTITVRKLTGNVYVFQARGVSGCECMHAFKR